MIATKYVRVVIGGRLGRITLHRPRAINALTLTMIEEVDFALDRLERDSRVHTVLLNGAGDRGFCAGGDVKALLDSALGDGEAARRFWRSEYRLIARIASFPKPVVAVMDGIVMGAGVGLAGHASHRIVTERLVLAMPEVRTGLAPGAGGSHLLSRAPGELGTWIGLTGGRIGAGDALALGFADHFVRSDRLDDLVGRLEGEGIDEALAIVGAASGAPPLAELADELELANGCFSGDDVGRMKLRLEGRGGAVAEEAMAALTHASPTSLKVTLMALRRAAALPSLRACLAEELKISCSLLELADLREGILALAIDKCREPVWTPADLDAVSDADVVRIIDGPPGLEPLWDPASREGAGPGPPLKAPEDLAPESRAILAEMAALGLLDQGPQDVAGLRERALAERQLMGEPPSVERIEEIEIETPRGPLVVRLYHPPGGRPKRAILWLHGGGWILGDLDHTDVDCRGLCRDTGSLIASVDYRLAPEHPFPAGLEDAYSGLVWLTAELAVRDGPPRVFVAGDSAGGNLAAALCLLAKDRGGPCIHHQLLIYPVTARDCDTDSYRRFRDGYLLDRATMLAFWEHYAPGSEVGHHVFASVLDAPDLRGLPPATFVIAGCDVLRDEAEAYAGRLRVAGVAVDVLRYPGQLHGFWTYTGVTNLARAVNADIRTSFETGAGRRQPPG